MLTGLAQIDVSAFILLLAEPSNCGKNQAGTLLHGTDGETVRRITIKEVKTHGTQKAQAWIYSGVVRRHGGRRCSAADGDHQ